MDLTQVNLKVGDYENDQDQDHETIALFDDTLKSAPMPPFKDDSFEIEYT